jgi:hypothetical protein
MDQDNLGQRTRKIPEQPVAPLYFLIALTERVEQPVDRECDIRRCPTEASADTVTISSLSLRTRFCSRRLATMAIAAATIAAASNNDNAISIRIIESIQPPISGLARTAASAIRSCQM